MKEKDNHGLPKYLEKDIVVLDEKEDFGQKDIFLTDAPIFVLSDVLSSYLNYFEIKSENYLWNIEENGEIKSMGKQGKIPLDILTVYQWDVGDIDTKKQKVIKYYYKNPMLELEAGKVYKFKAEWKKDNIDRNNFYGTTNYVLVTE